MPPCPSCKGSTELTVSKKAFVASQLLQELLPKNALQLASPLPEDDKEVLAYLVAFGRHVTEASSPASKLPWRPWKSPSSKIGKQSSPPHELTAEVSSINRSSFVSRHDSTYTCYCFACYATFWSRWDTSPNRDSIHDILEVVEISAKFSKGKRKKKQDKRKGESFPSCGLVLSAERAAAAVNETAKDFKKAVDDDAPLNNTKKKEGPSKGKENKESKEVCDSTNVKNDASNLVALMDKVYHSMVAKKAFLPSEVKGDHVRDVKVKGDLVNAQGPEGLSLVGTRSKLSSRKKQHSRTGKCKSNQVIPLDYEEDGPLPCEEVEPKVEVVIEASHACKVARGSDACLEGRSFLARLFPDALGRVTSHIWGLVSVKFRSRTMEYE